MKQLLAGIDIGGTKCAVSLGRLHSDEQPLELLSKRSFPTPRTPEEAMEALTGGLGELIREAGFGQGDLRAVGVNCGGPLDCRTGVVLSPPNLPGWDRIDVCTPFRERFGVPAALQNDANASALAEWLWGAGRGSRHMVFLTFGTGMGAGLILNGKLYEGASDMAGEVGHVRMDDTGPIGYGKPGSFEGYCSGGGIARLARQRAEEAIAAGMPPYWCASAESYVSISAKAVFEAAHAGESTALGIVETVGTKLGQGLAVLIDILNPECIVIGSIYARQEPLLRPIMMRTLEAEALPQALRACRIVPSGLGEKVGDWAALSVAYDLAQRDEHVN